MLNLHRKTNEIKTIPEKKRELECEEAIINEKARFGSRVRKTFMEYMREHYGIELADRVLRRINKRQSDGYFSKKA